MLRILLSIFLAFSLSSCDEISDYNMDNEVNSNTYSEDFEKAKVLSVHDGDTIRVKINGKKEKVRFVGVNTPEVAKDGNPAEFMAEEAKNYTEEILKDKEIYLERDISDRDKYDRLLRYIWLEKPLSNPELSDIENKTLNGILVKEGYAYANYYKPDIKYHNFLKDLEKSAQDNKLGIWSDEKNQSNTDKNTENKINTQNKLIKGNKNSNLYHLPEWDSYDTVKEKNAVYFKTEKEAQDAGFRPAR